MLELLKRIEAETEVSRPENTRIFVTGSGGSGLSPLLGAKFVQEVNAVSLAVEQPLSGGRSVIELGGQDAKIIVFKDDRRPGKKKKIPSMNDKCAGGTGAVIDKINAKLRIPAEKLCELGYEGLKLHPVAGKCGVFAETDINGLQKQGVPPNELMASLFEAIVHAEPVGAHPRQHAPAACASARRPQHLHQGHASSAGSTTSRRSGKSGTSSSRRARIRRTSSGARATAQYFAAIGAVRVREDRGRGNRPLQRLAGPRGIHHRRAREAQGVEEGRGRRARRSRTTI